MRLFISKIATGLSILLFAASLTIAQTTGNPTLRSEVKDQTSPLVNQSTVTHISECSKGDGVVFSLLTPDSRLALPLMKLNKTREISFFSGLETHPQKKYNPCPTGFYLCKGECIPNSLPCL